MKKITKIDAQPTTRTVGKDCDKYTVVVDATTGNAIKESEDNAKAFNDAMHSKDKVIEEFVENNYKLGPGETSIDRCKFKLDESLFTDANPIL